MDTPRLIRTARYGHLVATQSQIGQQLKMAEVEADRAAQSESTLEANARAFAQVLLEHGFENVDEEELRRQFGD